MLGDQARAAGAFGSALKALDAERDGGSRPDYGSRLRDAAAVLALVSEANLGNIQATRSRAPAPFSSRRGPSAHFSARRK